MECDELIEIQIGEDVAVTHEHALVDALGGKANPTGGSQWLMLHDEAEFHIAEAFVGEMLFERIRQIPKREHGFIDTERAEPLELALEKRDIDDGEQWLRRRKGQWP